MIKQSFTIQLFDSFSINRKILSDEDKAVENAKWGLGIAAVVGMLIKSLIEFHLYFASFLGGLFMARKLLKK